MKADDLPINSPCDEDWSAMRGDSERRFCDHCARHVHDLSAMTKREAATLLRSAGGERLCVRYTLAPDGGIRFREAPAPAPLVQLRARPPERPRPAALARAGVAAALLAACTPHTHDAPCDDTPTIETHEEVVQGGIEEYTPPPQIDVPPPPVLEPTPIPHVEPLPYVEPPPPPPPPEPTVMGQAPVLMGDVAIEPEALDEPPPPPPPEPTHVKMGKIAPVDDLAGLDEDVPCDTPPPAPRRF